VTNNTTNNITNNNNVLVIAEFGRENVEHLLANKDFMNTMIAHASRATSVEAKGEFLPMFLQKLLFDPEHPENQTIKMTNSRGNTVKVHTKNGWKHEMMDTAVDRMNMRANTELEIYADEEDDHRADNYFNSVVEERSVKRQRQTTKNMLLTKS